MKGEEPDAIDGGYGWLVLGACFINQIILLGYVKAAGILFVEWQDFFQVGSKEVGWAGIILAFFGPCAGLVAGALTSRFGSRPVAVFGGFLTAASVAAQSFSVQLWHIYLLSVFASIGLGLAFQPSITVVSFFFKKRIGIANGVAYAGVGAGIVVMPPLLQFLCTRFGWQGALQILGAIILTTVLLSLSFRPTDREEYFILKSSEERRHEGADKGGGGGGGGRGMSCFGSFCNHLGIDLLWRYPRFGTLALSYAIGGFGYYSSVVFFSSRAVYDAGIPKREASFLISAIGVGSTIGRVGHGFLIQGRILSATQIYVISGYAAAVASLLNPVSNTLLTLFACAGGFGLFSGAYLAVCLMVAREYVPAASISRSFGVIILSSGVGIIFGTFTMGFLKDLTGTYTMSFITAGIAFALSATLTMGDMIFHSYFKKKPPRDQDGDVKEETKEDKEGNEGALFLNEADVGEVQGEQKKFIVQQSESSV